MARRRQNYKLTTLRLAQIRRAQRISARKRAARGRVAKKIRRNGVKLGAGIAIGVALSHSLNNSQAYPKPKMRKI